MPTSARKRRSFDMGRIREAMRGPGADTRVWIATARVDGDEDAREWDPERGWLVDVTFYGGPLDQEAAVPCRLGAAFAQDGGTQADPPGLGCEVLVAITDGDANSNPVIVARMHNAGGCQPPTTVNGAVIDQALADANHIRVTPHGELQQLGGNRRIDAPNQELVADGLAAIRGTQISLGGVAGGAAEPVQPFLRGTDEHTWIDLIIAATSTALSGVPTVGGALKVAFDIEITAALPDKAAALSAKIKGE